ncbi:MAG: hypothetical protein RR691_09645 [Eubacterium sp.]
MTADIKGKDSDKPVDPNSEQQPKGKNPAKNNYVFYRSGHMTCGEKLVVNTMIGVKPIKGLTILKEG